MGFPLAMSPYVQHQCKLISPILISCRLSAYRIAHPDSDKNQALKEARCIEELSFTNANSRVRDLSRAI